MRIVILISILTSHIIPQWVQTTNDMGAVTSLVKAPSGELYASFFGGTYGKVHRYTEGMGWIQVDSGIPGTAAWDLAFKGEYLFVATDAGVYRYSRNDGWVATMDNYVDTYWPIHKLLIKDSAIFASVDINGGNNGGIFRSLDNGNSWTIFNQRWNESLWTRDFAVIDSFLFMTADGEVYRSNDNGETWSIPYSDSVFDYDRNRLGVMGSRLFASRGDGGSIYRSDDFGRTWDRIAISLPGLTFLVHEQTLFVGGNAGSVFYSLDSGDTWHKWSEGISNDYRNVRSLLIHDEYLLAGTSIQVCDYSCGRLRGNIWQRPLSEVVPIGRKQVNNGQVAGLKMIRGSEVSIEFTLSKSGWAEVKMYTPDGKLVAKLVQGNFERGSHFVSLREYNLQSGLYLVRLEGPGVSYAQKVLLEG